MKTFLQWTEVKHLDLPVLNEKTARAGIAWWQYPPLYIRSHFPDGYFMPRAADAMQKMGDIHPPHKKHAVLHQIPKGM